MAYNYISLAGLLTQLSERLDDEQNIYWTLAELTEYIAEALRTWQSMAGYWRGRMIFNTSLNTSFYDLTQQTNSLIPFTVTDTQMVSEILYHLIEAQLTSAGVYVGTGMFNLDDITKAIERRRNQFLLETGMVLQQVSVPNPSPPESRVLLPDNVINIRRCAWLAPGGTPFGVGNFGAGPFNGPYGVLTNLWRSNQYAAQAFKQNWALQPQDPPIEYSVATDPPVTVDMIPPPLNPGTLKLLAVLAGSPLNPAVGVLMGVPDNLSWVVKWGALADLLSKAGQAQDLPRADYCQKRWMQGIQVARIHTSAIYAALNGKDTMINALASFDSFNQNWQNGIAPPTDVALASWNMFAVSPPPDGIYSVRLDVIQNAPIPVALTDQVQIGREELDVLLDYCQHLAMFKQGGQEFLGTTPLFERMFRLAGVYNETLKADVDFLEPMADRAIREEILRPRRAAMPQPETAEA